MIGFLHPWALVGLLAAGIPILLHLLARSEPPTVVFPAVRYLITTTQEHQRRLKLQHLLLLAVRTLLIVALVLAAAGPTLPLRGVPGHAPSALVLVVDNSPSSRGGGRRRAPHDADSRRRPAVCWRGRARTTRSGSSPPTAFRSAATRAP